jgi:hypothetical protein
MSFQPVITIPNVGGTFVALQGPGTYMWDGSTLDQPTILRLASKASANKYNFLIERKSNTNVAPINSVPQADAIATVRLVYDSNFAATDPVLALAQIKQVYDFISAPGNLAKLLRGEI